MRKRFEQQLKIGQLLIEDTEIDSKSKNALDELLVALKAVYMDKEYNEELFCILEKHIIADKESTGRKGMDLWPIFVLSQVRLCMNISYNVLHNLSNNHQSIRQIMGVETWDKLVKFSYQNVYDNVSVLSDEMLKEINAVIVKFGHGKVFKKKEDTVLRLKTDSYVVESNVHFPTDYNLLWDCIRKSLDVVGKLVDKHAIEGWRKIKNWRYELKGLMRSLGRASASGGKNKAQREKTAAAKYLQKAELLVAKLTRDLPLFPMESTTDLGLLISLEYYISLLSKHINLVERRILKGEKIPHEEKMFSIFETYTEWINKGKSRPNVELGKRLTITTDQYNLIVDHRLLDHQEDRTVVIDLADTLIDRYKIDSWSFDKGYWSKENKELLQLSIPKVILPKLGKRTAAEQAEEQSRGFKKLKNKHSTIESNINELENRGLDRCPDRGIARYKSYIELGICAYNLKKIGRQLLKNQEALLCNRLKAAA